MFEKIFKSAVIIIAVFLIGLSFYIIVSPSKAISQVSPSTTTNYVFPESHVWEAISSNNAVSGYHRFLLYNKKTGEYKSIE